MAQRAPANTNRPLSGDLISDGTNYRYGVPTPRRLGIGASMAIPPHRGNLYDATGGEYAGTWFDHDVYVLDDESLGGMGSIVARYGDKPWEYASMPLKVLRDSIESNGNIGGVDESRDWSMPYRDWLFSDRSIPSTSAMILALAVRSMK